MLPLMSSSRLMVDIPYGITEYHDCWTLQHHFLMKKKKKTQNNRNNGKH